MKESNTALVGFSVNAEVSASYDGKTPLEKAPLNSWIARIGGTSANVALAINALGGESRLLALTGKSDDFSTNTLEYVFRNCIVPYKKFPILTTSHTAFLPDDGIQTKKIFGQKGTICTDSINEVVAEIEKENGRWRIATGVRLEEVALVKSLFNKHLGYRSLNPRMELIKDRKLFEQVLSGADLLILNEPEYRACETTSPSDLHKYGPSLVIVTDSENGGMFSHRESGAERFKACTDYITSDTKIYTTGAGDWFHGGFMSECLKLEKPIPNLSHEDIVRFLTFATQVAGKKVTMEGASNGPQRKDL